MTLMKNFICGYLDSDNHHDIVSIFWLGKKLFWGLKKNIFLHTKIFLRWVFSGHVTARSMSRQPFDAEWDFIWHNAYHKVTLTQNSDVMKKYPAGKNTTIFSSVTKNCLNCLMLPPSLRNEHLGKSNICCAGDKVQRSQTLWFPKITRETKTLNYTKIFHWGSKKNIPFSGCHLSTALHLGTQSLETKITHKAFPVFREQQQAAVSVIKHIPRHYFWNIFIHLRFCVGARNNKRDP